VSNHKIPDIPGYKIVKVIGEGGMGIVYLAIQSVLERKVALKVTLPALAEMDESFTKRFVREAKATAALNHPNIITIFDAGVYENSSYMAMEYIPTGTLSDLGSSALSHEKICELFIGICRGLSAAHKAGFVHRDIKPDNILIDGNGHPQVTDFGIVKSLGTQNTAITLAGGTIGTPQYMSPEQIKAEKLDGRSDLYSVGVMMYNLLEGHVPFYDETPSAVYIKHVTTTAPPLSKKNAAYQPIIKKLLRKDPENRYADAEHLVRELRALRDSGFAVNPMVSDITAVNPDDIPDEIPKKKPRNTNIKRKVVTGAPTVVDHEILQDINRDSKSFFNKNMKAIVGIAALIAVVGIFLLINNLTSNNEDSEKQQRQIAKDKRNQEHQTYWEKAKKANSIASYQRYLNKYPQGSFKSQALDQQNILKQKDQEEIDKQKKLAEVQLKNTKTLKPIENSNEANDLAETDKGKTIDKIVEENPETSEDANTVANTTETDKELDKAPVVVEKPIETEPINKTVIADPVDRKQLIQGEITQLLEQAQADEEKWNLMSPVGNNAYEKYKKILVIDGNNEQAKKGILELASKYISLANSSQKNKKFSQANQYINNALSIRQAYIASGYDSSELFGVSKSVSINNIKSKLNQFNKEKRQFNDEKKRLAEQNTNLSMAESYKKGEAAYKAKNYSDAEKWLLIAANKNDERAQTLLGDIYFSGGNGVQKNTAKAFQWYEKAGNQNYSPAQTLLGVMYERGIGISQNSTKAIEWYKKAANQGSKTAQNNLGYIYFNGAGVNRDKEVAFNWYLKAANQGSANAQGNIGLMYYNGEGIKRNYYKAYDWYLKAANQNHSDAQSILGIMYEIGRGVKKSKLKAIKWYKKAAVQGNELAIEKLKQLGIKDID